MAAILGYAPAAGDRAAALGSHREAARHYAAALAHTDSVPDRDRLSLLERYAQVAHVTGRLLEARDARREAIECASVSATGFGRATTWRG